MRMKLKTKAVMEKLSPPSSPTTGRPSTHVSPAAIRNMHTKARSKRRNSPGADSEKKLTPRIASASGKGWGMGGEAGSERVRERERGRERRRG